MEEVSALKIRIKFAKEGTMKFIGHLDVMRYFQKVMRRADVDIRYSEGFSPHQIMSFASPLGVGMESRGEYVDIEVLSTDSSEEMLRRINGAMTEGVEVLSYRLLPDTAANAMSLVAAADYTLRFRMKKTKKGEKEVNIRPMIYEMEADEEKIFLKIAAGSAANLKPDVLIRAYMESQGETMADFALMITRNELYADSGSENSHQFLPLEAFGENIE